MSSDDRPDNSEPDTAATPDDEDGGASTSGDTAASSSPTLAERRAATSLGRRRPRRPTGPGWMRMAVRYGPFAAVAVLVVAAVAVFGGDGDDGDDPQGPGSLELTTDATELAERGPMTWSRAEAEGVDVDWGPTCDTERGTITLPTVYAPPCVEPFEGSNGGATAPGVTEDEILVVQYHTDPELDPLGASIVGGAGADTNPDTAQQALEDYVAVYNEVYETYGRRVRLEKFVGTGAADDRDAARRDARAIAAMEPFAVLGSPLQATDVFSHELAANGVICGMTCSLAEPEAVVEDPDYNPYIWLPGPTPDQAALATVEMISKLAGPGPAELAGDAATRAQDRVYGIVHYDTPDNLHEGVYENLRDGLAAEGIDVATDVRFELDLARAQDNARTIVARLKDAGVTTVVYYGDPFTPSTLTNEATAQDYHPEWIMGPTVLGDSIFFGRLNDGEQWSHGFGLGILPANDDPSITEAYHIYEWAYGRQAPNNTVVVSEPPMRSLFSGIHMAGPDLTPETFRDGLFRLPPAGGSPTTPGVSRGDHDRWPDEAAVDWGTYDDFGIIWWDPDAAGIDELGSEGQGMYRYANQGQRYPLGDLPSTPEEAGLYDEANAPALFEELPPENVVPDYQPPDL